MLMQLKPGRHGSDSDVHSLMSAEVGVGDREPAQPHPSPSIWVQGYTGRRPVLGSRSAQVRTMGSDCSITQKAPIFRTHAPASCFLMEQLKPGVGGIKADF